GTTVGAWDNEREVVEAPAGVGWKAVTTSEIEERHNGETGGDIEADGDEVVGVRGARGSYGRGIHAVSRIVVAEDNERNVRVGARGVVRVARVGAGCKDVDGIESRNHNIRRNTAGLECSGVESDPRPAGQRRRLNSASGPVGDYVGLGYAAAGV